MKPIILLDFGSTFTKAVLVDREARELLMSIKVPSTVQTNATIALKSLYQRIQSELSQSMFEQAPKYATSSAAGGLRMAVIGLTSSLSIIAGKNAAFGAGAKILRSYSGPLSMHNIHELESLNLEIILFCGGYENGNVNMLLHNADLLSKMRTSVPIIYAGNSIVSEQVLITLKRKGKVCIVVNNIIPSIGVVDSTKTEEIIRKLFLKRIINMKGLDNILSMIDRIVMPTPAAVLEAGALLSKGSFQTDGLGDLLIVDIGGATTDIHSFCENKPYQGARIIGSPEPYGKRTVEGDLGMRESSNMVLKQINEKELACELGISTNQMMDSFKKRVENPDFIPSDAPYRNNVEAKIDHCIAKNASRIAVRRHVGRLEPLHSRVCTLVQRGKNLTNIRTIIGTGGPLQKCEDPAEILRQALITKQDQRLNYLLPTSIRTYLDREYVFFAAGILSEFDPDLAITIMKNSIEEIY
ncbi:MAG: glutamate mutase L [Tissierellia bacterium]|nr:glutamate mutase L [Tissierellia bacterium]